MFKNLRAEMSCGPINGKDIAERIGITSQAFYDKMSGRSEFKRSEMFKIQELFFRDFTLDYLFKWEDDKASNSEGNHKDKDYEVNLGEENKKHRIVKYHHHQHGILTQSFNRKEETWIFEAFDDHLEFQGAGLITVLDDLSKEGYELVCSIFDNEYILRTKSEIEGTEEYWDEDNL